MKAKSALTPATPTLCTAVTVTAGKTRKQMPAMAKPPATSSWRAR